MEPKRLAHAMRLIRSGCGVHNADTSPAFGLLIRKVASLLVNSDEDAASVPSELVSGGNQNSDVENRPTIMEFTLRAMRGNRVPAFGAEDLQTILGELCRRRIFDFEIVASKLARAHFDGQPDRLETLVRIASTAILSRSSDSGHRRAVTTGLWLDWLILLDPEMRGPTSGEQALWLRAVKGNGEAQALQSLLSVVLESGSAPLLHRRVDELLTSPDALEASSTMTLDILLATMRQSRRWLGTRGIGKGMSAWTLSVNHVGSVARHIVHSVAKEAGDGPKAVVMLKQRVALLLHIMKSEHHLVAVLDVLSVLRTDTAASGTLSPEALVAGFLITQLHFLKPHLSEHGSIVSELTSDILSMGSILDPLIQRALALLAPDIATQGADTSAPERAYVLVRKLALSHPRRLLRFVPSLAAMLSGSLDTDAQGLLFRRVDVFCDRVVGLIQALKPLAFHDSAAPAMETIVPPLVEFVRIATGEDDRLDEVVARAVSLLTDFAQANGSAARRALRSLEDVVASAARHCVEEEVAGLHPAHAATALKLMASDGAARGWALPVDEPVRAAAIGCLDASEAATVVATATAEMVNLIGSDASSAEATIEALLPWLLHPDGDARNAAYTAVCALAVNCTLLGRQVQSVLLQALEADDIDVVASAVEYAPEVYRATPGGGSQLIAGLVETCCASGIDTRPSIKAILQAAQPVV